MLVFLFASYGTHSNFYVPKTYVGNKSKRNALASSGVTNDRGPIFFSNDRTKGYYRVSKNRLPSVTTDKKV